jgi:uncharacterized protein YndB with AHSA1/START domain
MNPHDFDPGALAHVEHRIDGARSTLVFVRDFRHSPAKVWAALTDPEQLRGWAPFHVDRSLEQTGAVVLRMTDGQVTQEFEANVIRAVAPVLLEYSWGKDLVRWELAPHGGGTRLTLRHTVESPEWAPRVAAGWHLCLIVAEKLLDGERVDPIVGADAKKYGWEKLHDAYAERLGIAGKGWPAELFPEK